MYRRNRGYLDWVHALKQNKILFIFILFLSTQIQAADETSLLKIVPDRCISLHKGQVCYQKITLIWESSVVANYCLFQEAMDELLQCWDNANHGTSEFDFQSHEPLSYRLHRINSNKVVATSIVSVSWVYKSPKRQRKNWRLF